MGSCTTGSMEYAIVLTGFAISLHSVDGINPASPKYAILP